MGFVQDIYCDCGEDDEVLGKSGLGLGEIKGNVAYDCGEDGTTRHFTRVMLVRAILVSSPT